VSFAQALVEEGKVKYLGLSEVAPEDVRRAHADAVKGEMLKGGFAVFKGPIVDNKGKAVIAAGVAYPETAIQLESMNYLVQGVNGATA